MKKIIPGVTISVIAALLVFANAPSAFGKPQKKPSGSGQENADPLVDAAMKNMETGVWSVKGTVQGTKTIKLQDLFAGQDFDLTSEPGVRPNTPIREIIIKDKVWICSDGETWHAGQPNDRLIYTWVRVPIMADRKSPAFEKVGSEQRNGQTWLHVRLKVPEKNINPKELPQYWLVLDSQGQAQYIGHTEMPMFSQVRKEVMHCSFDYAPAKEKIVPPPLSAPVDDKAYGFKDIAYGNRANAKDEKGDLDRAIADYTRGIELNPKDSKDYSYRADAHAKKKQYAAAINDEQKAVELDPKNGDYYLSLGWYQLFNRKPRESITASLKALELSRDDVVIMNIKGNLAHAYLFNSQFEKAKAIYLENKDAKLRDSELTFSQVVLDDFKELQDAGITHPDMEKIKALLTATTDAR